jgi:hypothetical protein
VFFVAKPGKPRSSAPSGSGVRGAGVAFGGLPSAGAVRSGVLVAALSSVEDEPQPAISAATSTGRR